MGQIESDSFALQLTIRSWKRIVTSDDPMSRKKLKKSARDNARQSLADVRSQAAPAAENH